MLTGRLSFFRLAAKTSPNPPEPKGFPISYAARPLGRGLRFPEKSYKI